MTWSSGSVGPWATDGTGNSPANTVVLDATATALFALTAHISRPANLYESTDDGVSWSLVATGATPSGMDIDLAVTATG